jgi:hypothetical protein
MAATRRNRFTSARSKTDSEAGWWASQWKIFISLLADVFLQSVRKLVDAEETQPTILEGTTRPIG